MQLGTDLDEAEEDWSCELRARGSGQVQKITDLHADSFGLAIRAGSQLLL
ncbi:hypothetical protein [Micromonospora schwarzwaldensis]